VKRAFLFGLTTQFFIASAGFLLFVFDPHVLLPRETAAGVSLMALCFGMATAFFALKETPHPSWPVKLGMWIAGFLAFYVIQYGLESLYHSLFVVGLFGS
jgi:peptidoglycan/LPS O-acetylase OafA/YrhL